MKIRNGFVSNSSSSSFMLYYHSDHVISDPAEIIKLINAKPYEKIILNGGECSEGDDIFEMDSDMKSLVRKFPERFIECNSGTTLARVWDKHDNYTTKEVPKLIAYIGDCKLEYDDYNWFSASKDVDMSDIPEPAPGWNEAQQTGTFIPSEVREKYMKEIVDWCRIQQQRISQKQDDLQNKLIQDAKATGYTLEFVEVDNQVCEDSWDFKERYLTSECADSYFSLMKKASHEEAVPFGIAYKEVYRDVQEILDYIADYVKSSKKDTLALVRYNQLLEYDQPASDIDIYYLGDKELKLILDNASAFKQRSESLMLFVNAKAIKGDTCDVPAGKLLLGYGDVAEIQPGKDIPDFKQAFIQEEEEY